MIFLLTENSSFAPGKSSLSMSQLDVSWGGLGFVRGGYTVECAWMDDTVMVSLGFSEGSNAGDMPHMIAP